MAVTSSSKNVFFLFNAFLLLITSVGVKYGGGTENTATATRTETTTGVTANQEETDEEEMEEPDLSVFNRQYVDRIEESFNLTSKDASHSMLSKLGKIALYLRLYRSSITSPITGHRGFDHFFPQPSVRFNRELYLTCSGKITNFTECVDTIFRNIQQRAKFLFPQRDQLPEEELRLDSDDFARRVPNSMFSFDISASYLLCFLTKNALSVFERLPFCIYGLDHHQNNLWPARRFRQTADSGEIDPKTLDPIDTILDPEPMGIECADVSFCPDPCCGRKSKRFFRGTPANTSGGFCSFSACSMNVKHLDEWMAAKYFKSQENDEDLEKEEDNGTTTEAGSSTESTTTTMVTTKKSGTEKADSEIDTHYCYLDNPFNDDFTAIMQNRWNLSCACAFANRSIDHSKIYRFDVLQCVDFDECQYSECPEGEECLNMEDGFECVCPIGYRRVNGKCTQIKFDLSSALSNDLLN